MDDNTKEELKELALQIVISALLAMSTVLVTSLLNKLRFGYITKPRNIYRGPSRYRKDNFILDLEEEDDDYEDFDPEWHQ